MFYVWLGPLTCHHDLNLHVYQQPFYHHYTFFWGVQCWCVMSGSRETDIVQLSLTKRPEHSSLWRKRLIAQVFRRRWVYVWSLRVHRWILTHPSRKALIWILFSWLEDNWTSLNARKRKRQDLRVYPSIFHYHLSWTHGHKELEPVPANTEQGKGSTWISCQFITDLT